MYRYRIRSTGRSSAVFGPCEVCLCHAAEVYLQVEEKSYPTESGTEWTRYECQSLFGHEQCLISNRQD